MLFNCNNGTWDSILTVDPTFAENFYIGGPMGFSMDLVSLPEEYKKRWSDAISQYKADRDFFRTAVAHILVDSDNITVIEYASEDYDRAVLQVFTKVVNVETLRVYPILDKSATYTYRTTTAYGENLVEDGILFNGLVENSCVRIDFQKA